MILCYGAVKLIIMFTFQTASQFPKRDNHSADHVWFFCVLFPIFRYHNESPTHFDSIIENALPWVMGHMGHGSSIQWVTWVMGHSKWPIAYPGTEEELPRMQAYWWIAAEQCDSITLQQAINLLICSNIKNIMFHRNKNIKYKTKKIVCVFMWFIVNLYSQILFLPLASVYWSTTLLYNDRIHDKKPLQ